MIDFRYVRADSIANAVHHISADPTARFIAGGTNLVDLMKEGVERPSLLVDISHLPLDKVEGVPSGAVRIGALVSNADLAYHPLIMERYPLLSSALLA
jgi:xanthine dehydrogenase YagS FAD-binding subunit